MSMQKLFKKNPFLTPFIIFALICVLVLSLEFFSIIHSNNKATKEAYYQEKLELLLNDFELQMDNLVSLTFHFSLDNTYKYSVISKTKYNEILLLKDFEKYKYSSPLTENFSLYYGSNSIFHVSGNLINLEVYLNALSITDSERDNIISILHSVVESTDSEPLILSTTENIFLLIPFQTDTGNKKHTALLLSVVSFEEFTKRVQAVSGLLDGTLFFYQNNELFYSNQEESTVRNTDNIITVASPDQTFLISFVPKKTIFNFDWILFEIFFIFVDILLILFLAQIFATRTFQPIQNIQNKYQPYNISKDNPSSSDIFSELDSMLHNTMTQYIAASNQAEQLEMQLKHQLLKQLLNRTYSTNIQSQLDALNICLPGLYFYVICISLFSHEAEETLQHAQNELEQLSSADDKIAIHAVLDSCSKQLLIICNISECSQKLKLIDDITEIVESYFQNFSIGIGKTYSQIDKISVSYLESVDHAAAINAENEDFSHNNTALQLLTEALCTGSYENAIHWLNEYAEQNKQINRSLLMLQYSIAAFIGEISKLSKQNNITLSNVTLSQLFSSKDQKSFFDSAQELILEYCNKYQERVAVLQNEHSQHICSYINEHFMEYDISIELVAETLGLSTAVVRNAILQNTGMLYKDYLTKLRIDHAKILLHEGNLSIAEISQTVGYSSVSYFIKLFKNATGFTPAKYMKNIVQS